MFCAMAVLRAFVCSVGLGALAGCGGASSGSAGTNPLIATTTSLSATPASVVFGATVTFTAAVLYAPAETASGTVTFFDRGAILGSSTLDPEGVASLKVTTLAVGTHIVTASFPGNSTTAASASAALTVTVTAPPAAKMAATATPSRASTSLPGLGMPIERVVTVQPARETALPSGTVTFEEGSFSLSESRPIHASISNVADTVTYDHPLRLSIRAGETAVSCADPATIKVESGDGNTWYLYCASDALITDDREHSIDVFESKDLIRWTYDGNALTGRPSWAPDGPLGSPAIEYMNGQYMLYYTSPSSKISATKGPAIGVGVSSSPKGPFIDHGLPVAEPATGDCCVGRPRSMIELDVEQSNGQNGDNSIGPGRNVLFTDESGQDYILYRYPGARDCTTCPAWISPLDWSSDGWPTVGQVHVDFQDQLENSFKVVE